MVAHLGSGSGAPVTPAEPAIVRSRNSSPTWTGVYTELIEISDNVFSGTSGAILVDTAPQNSVTDERLRNIVVEPNIFQGSSTHGGRQLLVSAVNETVRDNVFNQSVAGGGQGIQVAKRGIEPVPQFVEITLPPRASIPGRRIICATSAAASPTAAPATP